VEDQLHLDILAQPDETTCGPTCLHAVYRFHGDSLPLQQVLDEVDTLGTGGTLAVLLGIHALRRGYDATMYTFNLEVYDPTWFDAKGNSLPNEQLVEKLLAQRRVKTSRKLRHATDAYVEFLRLGGRMRMQNLNGTLVRRCLRRSTPLLTGLSATYLYAEPRERQPDPAIPRWVPDDIRGEPSGHFVVLCGYDPGTRSVLVTDPLAANPFAEHQYVVGLDRVTCAILLGNVTYDANLLVVEPRRPRTGGSPCPP
jgi:hypothetical protein